MHGHAGRPGFSRVDLSENAKFLPNSFNQARQIAHGAMVLSRDSVVGQVVLVDPDILGLTSLNRLVGAPIADVQAARLKIEIAQRLFLG